MENIQNHGNDKKPTQNAIATSKGKPKLETSQNSINNHTPNTTHTIIKQQLNRYRNIYLKKEKHTGSSSQNPAYTGNYIIVAKRRQYYIDNNHSPIIIRLRRIKTFFIVWNRPTAQSVQYNNQIYCYTTTYISDF